MSAELLINVTPSESRVALIENGILQEIHVERHTKRGLVGISIAVKLAVYYRECRQHLLISV